MPVRNRFFLYLILALSLTAAPALAADSAVTPLQFGIVPQQSSTELARLWGPIIQYLSDKSGVALTFHTAKDIPTFDRRAADGRYDIVYMNPYTYTVVRRTPAAYNAFAKEKDKKLRGILVVRANSPYKKLEDLSNKTLAFPAATAIAASVIPRAHLTAQGIPFTAKYVSSHDSVYLSVAKGLYPAGGGVGRTFEAMPADVRKQLRILWTTPAYTPHPFAAHKRVAPEIVARIRAAMLGMDRDPVGKALLERIAFTGVVAAADAEYDDVRALNVNISDHLMEKGR